MLAGLIGAAASGLKGAADAYSIGAKSEFDKGQKVELSQQLLDMEEQKALRVDEITRSRNIADVPRLATAQAEAAPIVAKGVLSARSATAQGIKDLGIQGLEAQNEAAGITAKATAGVPEAEAALKAKQLAANKGNVTEAATQTGVATATEQTSKTGVKGYLGSVAAETNAKEQSGSKAQAALANFTLTNAKVLQDARNLLAKETDPEKREELTRSISDLSGASTKNFGDVATAARSWVTMAQNLRKDAEMASPDDAKELTTRAQGYEQSADALLKSIADKRLPGSNASALPAPPAGAISDLRADPTLAPAFDQKYGKGAAAKYLKAK
jgi:hypothetical protein